MSIITPMYNGAAFVGETIESVLRQTYEKWEMIIVDDCSPDNGESIRVVKQFSDHRIHLIESKINKGSSGARNTALKQARGQYIAFLDSDDLWPEDYLMSQLRALQEKNAVIIYGAVQLIDECTKHKIGSPYLRPSRVNYNDTLKVCFICPSAAIYDTSRVRKYYFRESLRSMRDDYVYWLDMLKEVDWAYYNPNATILYRVRQSAVTANKKKVISAHWKVLREVLHLPLGKSVYCLICWAINNIQRLYVYKIRKS